MLSISFSLGCRVKKESKDCKDKTTKSLPLVACSWSVIILEVIKYNPFSAVLLCNADVFTCEGDYVFMTLITHTGVGGCEVRLKEVLGGQSVSGLTGN